MSKKYHECPLYNHNNCKDIYMEQICAIVREDKICLKKIKNNQKFTMDDTPEPIKISAKI